MIKVGQHSLHLDNVPSYGHDVCRQSLGGTVADSRLSLSIVFHFIFRMIFQGGVQEFRERGIPLQNPFLYVDHKAGVKWRL